MNTDKIVKHIMFGASALIGIIVAEGMYRAGVSAMNKRELIGDGEIVSDEVEAVEEFTEEDIPF